MCAFVQPQRICINFDTFEFSLFLACWYLLLVYCLLIQVTIMMFVDTTNLFTVLQDFLWRMEEQLSANVEQLKHNHP